MNKADLQTLNDVAWAEVTHAYGPAVDAPDMLRQLMEGGDDLEEATEFLFGALTHQGTLYSATLPVLRFCVRVLDQLSVEATEQVVAWIQFVGSLTRTSPEAPYAAELRAEAISVVEALLALDAKKGGEYYTRALGTWRCDAENGLSDRVRTRLQECLVDGGTLAALGTWGGNLSTYLTSDDLGVRAAAAFHDRSNAGTAALIEVLGDPDIEEVWLEIEPEGRLDDVADELLTRNLGALPEADRAQLESLAVLYASTNFMPWEHFLQLINAGNGNGVLDADATRRFLHAVVDNDFLWQTPYAAAALVEAGLPGDREELREMVGGAGL